MGQLDDALKSWDAAMTRREEADRRSKESSLKRDQQRKDDEGNAARFAEEYKVVQEKTMHLAAEKRFEVVEDSREIRHAYSRLSFLKASFPGRPGFRLTTDVSLPVVVPPADDVHLPPVVIDEEVRWRIAGQQEALSSAEAAEFVLAKLVWRSLEIEKNLREADTFSWQ